MTTKHPWISRKVECKGVPCRIIDVRGSHFGDQFKVDYGDRQAWVTADNFHGPPKYSSPDAPSMDLAGANPVGRGKLVRVHGNGRYA